LTESNLIIATGSTDSKIYFYDSNNGNEIHSIQMESPGSSPPISYMVNNEQFISVVATGGGRTMGAGNKIYGYNLQNE
jgi:glucose dehydrogenase